ncbi:MAG: DivIVA domain-containing protein [Propionibacteriaceae bacterium]|jgi:DivIVA domain-containing protein|nr:DivIVA domain-containing protein [Propionibacteriaceae bacterium]
MEWFIVVLAVIVIGFGAVAASGRLGQMGGSLADDQLVTPGSQGVLTADEIAGARFAITSPGYSVDQVDALLTRVETQWRDIIAGMGPGSGIMDSDELSDRRNHDGSDETSHR